MDTTQLTRTSIRQFKFLMHFIADHDLWDEVEEHLSSDWLYGDFNSGEPIIAVRRFIQDKFAGNVSYNEIARRRAHEIAECGCGVSNPGPYPPPVMPPPSGGGGDGGGNLS